MREFSRSDHTFMREFDIILRLPAKKSLKGIVASMAATVVFLAVRVSCK